ncbi:MAG TPA: DUF1003 domain-containing protein [Mycobacteriales bacterium]|nr:DUF1003 domain-containing protein [Mycobacteriales bacterium]HWB67412.1 DUF1003 domain-containing protein [Mycobacteriales bacterium]
MARENRRQSRLDQPQDTRRSIALPRYNADSMGRISERVARFLGTWRFIGYMSLFIGVWIIYNVVVPTSWRFDQYSNKFTLLTLLLSLQASYAAPLILLAQNRQADRDRVQYEADRALSERAVNDTEYLTREIAAIRLSLGEVATRDYIRGELQRLLDELAPDRPDPEADGT